MYYIAFTFVIVMVYSVFYCMRASATPFGTLRDIVGKILNTYLNIHIIMRYSQYNSKKVVYYFIRCFIFTWQGWAEPQIPIVSESDLDH